MVAGKGMINKWHNWLHCTPVWHNNTHSLQANTEPEHVFKHYNKRSLKCITKHVHYTILVLDTHLHISRVIMQIYMLSYIHAWSSLSTLMFSLDSISVHLLRIRYSLFFVIFYFHHSLWKSWKALPLFCDYLFVCIAAARWLANRSWHDYLFVCITAARCGSYMEILVKC